MAMEPHYCSSADIEPNDISPFLEKQLLICSSPTCELSPHCAGVKSAADSVSYLIEHKDSFILQ